MTVVSDASPLHYLVLIKAEAIGLALEMRAKTLLIDERDGTRIARGLGVATAGTLGVLVLREAEGVRPDPIRLGDFKKRRGGG
jgi:hypothetical protein